MAGYSGRQQTYTTGDTITAADSNDEFDAILDIVLKVDDIIQQEATKRGLIHVDGKKEFALGVNRKPVLVDSFGTLDEDRWWAAAD